MQFKLKHSAGATDTTQQVLVKNKLSDKELAETNYNIIGSFIEKKDYTKACFLFEEYQRFYGPKNLKSFENIGNQLKFLFLKCYLLILTKREQEAIKIAEEIGILKEEFWALKRELEDMEFPAYKTFMNDYEEIIFINFINNRDCEFVVRPAGYNSGKIKPNEDDSFDEMLLKLTYYNKIMNAEFSAREKFFLAEILNGYINRKYKELKNQKI